VTDGWTDRWTNGHGMTTKTTLTCSISQLKQHQIVLMCCCTISIIHTYCSAQLTGTLNCKHHLQYIGFSVSLCVMCNLNLLLQFAPRYIALRNECSREHSLPGTKVPRNFCSWAGNFHSEKRKYQGTKSP